MDQNYLVCSYCKNKMLNNIKNICFCSKCGRAIDTVVIYRKNSNDESYRAYFDNAIVIRNIFKYKMFVDEKGRNACQFGKAAYNKVINKLSKLNINFMVVDNKQITYKEWHEKNYYRYYLSHEYNEQEMLKKKKEKQKNRRKDSHQKFIDWCLKKTDKEKEWLDKRDEFRENILNKTDKAYEDGEWSRDYRFKKYRKK